MAQTRSFATIGPSLWNALPSSLRLTLLSGSRLASPSLLKLISTLGFFTLGVLLSALYCERCFINLEIRYDILWILPIPSRLVALYFDSIVLQGFFTCLYYSKALYNLS